MQPVVLGRRVAKWNCTSPDRIVYQHNMISIGNIYIKKERERRIFGPKRDEVTEEWRKLHNDLYSLPNIVRVIQSRRMIWAGHVARVMERRRVYRVLVEEREGNRPLGRPRRKWEDNIKMDLHDIKCGGVDWIELARDRDRRQALVTAVMNRRVP